jgi:hypothetical protein
MQYTETKNEDRMEKQKKKSETPQTMPYLSLVPHLESPLSTRSQTSNTKNLSAKCLNSIPNPKNR